MKLILSISLLIFVLSIKGQDKNAIKYVDNYINAAFWKVQENYQPLIKWPIDKEVIKYKIVGKREYLKEKSWNKFIIELSQLIEIRIMETNQNDYDILIFFGDLMEYGKLANTLIPVNADIKFNNWSSRKWNKDYSLTSASFCIVPSKINNMQEGIFRLKSGLLKSLGLLGEIENEYSIFYKFPNSYNGSLTREDKRIIKMHYNEFILPGATRDNLSTELLGLSNINDLSKEKL
ncbi:hypothetical protein [Marinoscillum pacificum]|uniref:hypothetical protein n=1 Tax=Marinoscillum pacificum TaxID=392723 RepID=UPI00215739AB|nr:hypothetical protein [Marinoscillum pacificum]